MQHTMYIGPPCFPVFNDRPDLSTEAIEPADVVPFERSASADMEFAASASWSSDCDWYFVVLPEGIALFNVHDRRGLLCRRHSAAFIETCLKSGLLSKRISRHRRRSEPDSHDTRPDSGRREGWNGPSPRRSGQ